MQFETGLAVTEHVKTLTDRVLVHYSLGKDSLATLIEMRKHFGVENVEVVYYYHIPDLAFVEENLDYTEAWLGKRIHRMPWHNLVNNLTTNGIWQGMGHHAASEPLTRHLDLHDDVRKLFCRDTFGLEDGDVLWTARGFRTSDSMTRRQMMERAGVIHFDTKCFEPIWDWKKGDVLDAIKAEGLTLSQDYVDFGRSWEGVNPSSMQVLKEKYPEDYARVLEWYPRANVCNARQKLVVEKYGYDNRSWRQRIEDGDAVQR